MTTPTFDEAATAEHRRIFPDRKCEASNSRCAGPVSMLMAGDQWLCAGHSLAFSDADHAGRGVRLAAWVRAQRADVPPREG